jgi:hypothetical protein
MLSGSKGEPVSGRRAAGRGRPPQAAARRAGLDVRNITASDDQARELSAEQVAGYIAKYATKATESFGSGLDRRLTDDDLDQLDQLPAHVAELVRACWALGGRPELEGLRMRPWAHMLGFRGTGRPRAAATPPPSRSSVVPGSPSPNAAAKDGVPLDAWGRPEDDDQAVIVASWVYVGSGYETEGSAGWPYRRPPGLVSSGGWPGRSYAPSQHE